MTYISPWITLLEGLKLAAHLAGRELVWELNVKNDFRVVFQQALMDGAVKSRLRPFRGLTFEPVFYGKLIDGDASWWVESPWWGAGQGLYPGHGKVIGAACRGGEKAMAEVSRRDIERVFGAPPDIPKKGPTKAEMATDLLVKKCHDGVRFPGPRPMAEQIAKEIGGKKTSYTGLALAAGKAWESGNDAVRGACQQFLADDKARKREQRKLGAPGPGWAAK